MKGAVRSVKEVVCVVCSAVCIVQQCAVDCSECSNVASNCSSLSFLGWGTCSLHGSNINFNNNFHFSL